jgi:hypothetical protein
MLDYSIQHSHLHQPSPPSVKMGETTITNNSTQHPERSFFDLPGAIRNLIYEALHEHQVQDSTRDLTYNYNLPSSCLRE